MAFDNLFDLSIPFPELKLPPLQLPQLSLPPLGLPRVGSRGFDPGIAYTGGSSLASGFSNFGTGITNALAEYHKRHEKLREQEQSSNAFMDLLAHTQRPGAEEGRMLLPGNVYKQYLDLPSPQRPDFANALQWFTSLGASPDQVGKVLMGKPFQANSNKSGRPMAANETNADNNFAGMPRWEGSTVRYLLQRGFDEPFGRMIMGQRSLA